MDNVVHLITSTKQCEQCGKLDNFHKTSNVLYPRCSILLFVVALFPVALILSCLVGEGWQEAMAKKNCEERRAKSKKKERKMSKVQKGNSLAQLLYYSVLQLS